MENMKKGAQWGLLAPFAALSLFFSEKQTSGQDVILRAEFNRQIATNGAIEFNDRFGAPGIPNLIFQEQTQGHRYIQSINENARSAFANTLVRSSKEIFVSTILPLDEWRDREDKATSFASDLFVGSFANTKEEGVEITSAGYTLAESFWQSQDWNKNLEYGIRPYNASPYIYLRSAWHNQYDEELLWTLVRYRYRYPSSGMVEAEITIPLVNGFQFSGGCVFDPFGLDRQDNNKKTVAFRIERQVGNNPLNIISLGTDTKNVLLEFYRNF